MDHTIVRLGGLKLTTKKRTVNGEEDNPDASPVKSSSRTTRIKDPEVPEAETDEIAMHQLTFLQRFRAHLEDHFGGSELAVEALDANDTGYASIDELLESFAEHGISDADDSGPFDLRRVFFILDEHLRGLINYKDLMYATSAEILDRVAIKQSLLVSEVSPRKWPSYTPTTDAADQLHVERFRLLLVTKFGDLHKAFGALDKKSKGILSFDDFIDATNALRFDLSDDLGRIDIEAVWDAMDVDGNDDLCLHEFLGLWPRRKIVKKKSSSRRQRSKRKSSKPKPRRPAQGRAAPKPLAPAAPQEIQALAEVEAQVELVYRFREHLLAHFGNVKTCFQALDQNGDGDLSFQELLEGFDDLGIKECDEEGKYFDLRRTFYVLDTDGSGELSINELLLTSKEKLRNKLLQRPNTNPKTPEIDEDYVSKNTLERFRRLVFKRWGSMSKAFKELDRDGTGDISIDDISAGLERRKVNIVDENGSVDLKVAFKAMDIDDSGSISVKKWSGVWPLSTRHAKAAVAVWKKFISKQPKEEEKKPAEKQPTRSRPETKRWGPRQAEVLQLFQAGEQSDRPAGQSRSMHKIEAFVDAPQQSELDIRLACTGDWGAERLSNGLSTVRLRQVQVINCHGNYMGDAGAIRLAPAIEGHCLLKKLILSLNGICDAGADKLSSLLIRVPTLEELDLSDNRIGTPGGKDFAKALSSKLLRPSVRCVDLQRNVIADIGVAALKQASKTAQELIPTFKVRLKGNPGDRKAIAVDVGVWGADPGHTPKARPIVLKPLIGERPPSRARGMIDRCSSAPTLDPEWASKALCEDFGHVWKPSLSLKSSIAFAKTVGEGRARFLPPSTPLRLTSAGEMLIDL